MPSGEAQDRRATPKCLMCARHIICMKTFMKFIRSHLFSIISYRILSVSSWSLLFSQYTRAFRPSCLEEFNLSLGHSGERVTTATVYQDYARSSLCLS